MRPISLHVSALNDAEYDFYTTSLIDLTEDDGEAVPRNDEYYDQVKVGVREVRAWLKGRFSSIQVAKIDEILRLFCPNMSAVDALSGGQFFAALRLTVHVESGKEVDRGLAFAQAFPRPSAPQVPASPPKRTLPMPPASVPMLPVHSAPHASNNPFTHPPMVQASNSNPFNPFTSQSQPPSRIDISSQKLPPLPPRKPQPPPRHASQLLAQPTASISDHRFHASTPSLAKAVHVTSPLMKQSLQASKVGQNMKRAEEQLEKERILQVLKSSNSSATSRTRSISPSKMPPHPPPRATSSSGSGSEATAPSHGPPLPRRQHRPVSPPVSTTSLEQVALARPGVVSEALHPFATSPFKTPDQPFKENSRFLRSPSVSPERLNKDLPPPKHPRRKPPPPIDSTLSSTSSVSALSSADSTSSFHSRPGNPESPLPPIPLNDSPTSRVYRSKSVHYPSPPPPVPPPLRKRRPESVQVVGGANVFDQLSQQTPSSPFGVRGPRSDGGGNIANNSNNGAGLSRHVSMSASTPSPKGPYYRRVALHHGAAADGDGTPLASFQRTLATIQPKLDALQPKLEKVRYKAEAGISKRGFLRDGRRWEGEDEEGLMGDGGRRRNGAIGDDSWDRVGGMDGGPDVDSGEDVSDSVVRGRRLHGPRDPGGPLLSDEQDNLKLPPGEGWKPL